MEFIQQGSPEWFAQRCGRVTASRISDIKAKTKSGVSASRKNYMAQLICERLTGRVEETYKSAPMQRGNDLEPKARAVYIIETGYDVTETGMIAHPFIEMSGASPDGLVGERGLVEIKCPNTATHIDFLRSGKPKPEYLLQMLWQMACTGREWCDFVSYDDRLPENLAYKCIRIERDNGKIAEIEADVGSFLAELDAILEDLGKL